MMEIKEYPLLTISRLPGDNIIYISFKENSNIDIESIKDMINNRLDFTGNEEHFLIIDLINVKNVSGEAKTHAFTSEDGVKNVLGGAFIASNPVSKLIANVLIKTSDNVPTKIFLTSESALDWLSELRKNIKGKKK